MDTEGVLCRVMENELDSAKFLWACRFAKEFYQLILEHLDDTTTLRDLLILTEISMALHENREVSIGDIVEATSLPWATVSRRTAEYVDKGLLAERTDPEDGRKRYVYHHPDAGKGHREWCERLFQIQKRLQNEHFGDPTWPEETQESAQKRSQG